MVESGAQSRTLRTVVLASGNILNVVAALLSMAVLARILDVQQYAAYRQVVLVFMTTMPLISLGLPEALFYLLPQNPNRARPIAVENMLLLAALGTSWAIALQLGAAELLGSVLNAPGIAHELRQMAPYAIFALLSLATSNTLIARRKTSAATLYNVATRLFGLLAVTVATLKWRTASAAITANVMAAMCTATLGVVWVLRDCPGGWRLTAKSSMDQIRFALPIGVVAMIAAVATSFDKLIVASMCSAAEFARYISGAIEVPIVAVITNSAMAVLLPDMARCWATGDRREALELWKRAAQKSALAIFPVFWFLMVMAGDFVTLLYSQRYAGSAPIFRIYLFLLPLRVVFFGTALVAAGRTKFLLITSGLGLLANAALAPTLIGLLGTSGGALAAVASLYCIQIPVTLYVIRSSYKVRFINVLPYRQLVTIALIGGAAAIVLVPIAAWKALGPAWRFGIGGALYSGTVLTAMVLARLINRSAVIDTLRRVRYGRISSSDVCAESGQ